MYSTDSIEHLTNKMYKDNLQFFQETDQHLKNANQFFNLDTSYPYQEPWSNGPPSFAYYTEVDIPLDQINCNLTTDPFCKLPNTIYIPESGPITSPIISKIVGLIVGKNGWWLKQLTQDTQLHYIWFNNHDIGVFQLWGRPERLPYAVTLLQQRINTIIHKYNQSLIEN